MILDALDFSLPHLDHCRCLVVESPSSRHRNSQGRCPQTRRGLLYWPTTPSFAPLLISRPAAKGTWNRSTFRRRQQQHHYRYQPVMGEPTKRAYSGGSGDYGGGSSHRVSWGRLAISGSRGRLRCPRNCAVKFLCNLAPPPAPPPVGHFRAGCLSGSLGERSRWRERYR